MPSARDFWAILAAAPAVQMQRIDVGGSAAGTQTGYSTYDTKADQHRPMVEGIVNTEGTNAAGFYYDYGSFDEVSVATGTNTRRDAVAGRDVAVHLEVRAATPITARSTRTTRTRRSSRATSTPTRSGSV